jgi:Zn-dependent protease
VRICARCGTSAPDTFVACPACKALFHAETLTRLTREAEDAERAGDLHAALARLREALPLLPRGAAQTVALKERIAALEERAPSKPANVPAWLGGLGAVGVALYKLAAPLLLLLPKLKIIFTGLFQAKTVLAMLFTTAVYGRAGYGASMLVVLASVYVHEMGHVYAFRRYGIEVSAPMFIPGLGAFVRGSHYPESRRAQADVALSGPVWGAATGALALTIAFAFTLPWLFGMVILIAEINAFNLIPVWQLDGSRAFVTMGRRDRLVVAAVGASVSLLAGSLMGGLASLGFLLRALSSKDEAASEPAIRNTLCALFVALALLRGIASAWMS